jgi:5-methyltetrahydrofolate--homocysteine methyltransferase
MRVEKIKLLEDLMKKRVIIMDGAMGTMLQAYKFSEEDFCGDRFKNHSKLLQGNNDILNITQPDAIYEVHMTYFRAGADIIETNTFGATTIAQADYGLEDYAYEINEAGAKIASKAAIAAEQEDGNSRFVAGSIGPTNRTASISPDVNDPGFRAVTFDDLRVAYGEQVRGLIAGGVDLLLIETIFDTLNAKAAAFAIDEVCQELGIKMPVMISGTISDLSGRVLSGQTVEAFWNSLSHVRPFSFGLNCGLGATEMRPYIAELSNLTDVPISIYPNAGLPNEFGEYDENPKATGELIGEFAAAGFLNIVGGCCGTTPEHIKEIAKNVKGKAPRNIQKMQKGS